MKKLRLIGLVAVMALIAVACSPDSGTPTTTPPPATSTTAAPATTTTTAPPPELQYDVGVTPAPCADAVNDGHGCIYLGIITDKSGPFAPLGIPLTDAQVHFWQKVNADGGLDGFDVIIREDDNRDAGYTGQGTVTHYGGIRDRVLALAQALGTPQTQAIINSMDSDNMVAAPAGWWSGWNFPTQAGDRGLILESGAPYCLEAMNGITFMYAAMSANEAFGEDMTWGAVYFAGDYGDDYLAGAKIAAAQIGLGAPLFEYEQTSFAAGGDAAGAVGAILQHRPDLVVMVTGPTEMAQITVGTYQNGHTTFQVLGASPTWNVGFLGNADLMALLQGVYKGTLPFGPWESDTPGHAAMRASADANNQSPNGAYGAGWAWQYPIKALLEAAIATNDLTRENIRAVAGTLNAVDYQGMLPVRDFTGNPNDNVVRSTFVAQADGSQPDGLRVISPGGAFLSPVAENFPFNAPCFVTGG